VVLSEVLRIGENRILFWKQRDPITRMDCYILGNSPVIDHYHLYPIEGDFEVLEKLGQGSWRVEVHPYLSWQNMVFTHLP